MTNLQIARDIRDRAQDAGDAYVEECAKACIRAFLWNYSPPWREWETVKAFWRHFQDAAS